MAFARKFKNLLKSSDMGYAVAGFGQGMAQVAPGMIARKQREEQVLRGEERQDTRQSERDQVQALEDRARRGDATVLEDPLATTQPGLKANLQSIINEAGNKMFGDTTEKATALSSPGVAAVGSQDINTTRTGIAAEAQAQGSLRAGMEKAIPKTGIGAAGSGPTAMTGRQAFDLLDQESASMKRQSALKKQATGIQQTEAKKKFAEGAIPVYKSQSKQLTPEQKKEVRDLFAQKFPYIAAEMVDDVSEAFINSHSSDMASDQFRLLSQANAMPSQIQAALTEAGLYESLHPAYQSALGSMIETEGQDKELDAARSGGFEVYLKHLNRIVEKNPNSPLKGQIPILQDAVEVEEAEKKEKRVKDLSMSISTAATRIMTLDYANASLPEGDPNKKGFESYMNQQYENLGTTEARVGSEGMRLQKKDKVETAGNKLIDVIKDSDSVTEESLDAVIEKQKDFSAAERDSLRQYVLSDPVVAKKMPKPIDPRNVIPPIATSTQDAVNQVADNPLVEQMVPSGVRSAVKSIPGKVSGAMDTGKKLMENRAADSKGEWLPYPEIGLPGESEADIKRRMDRYRSLGKLPESAFDSVLQPGR